MSTKSKSGILAFVDRYDQESVQALLNAGAELAFLRACTVYMGGYPPSPILIAVGQVGGEKLCQYIADSGLDGVQCVVLVGVTAPWAERGSCYGEWLGGSGGHKRWKRCYAPADYVSSFDADDADPEPLCHKHFDSLHPKSREMWKPAHVLLGPLDPLRAVAELARAGGALQLVIACTPDDGVCAKCGGQGILEISYDVDASGVEACPVCSIDEQPGSGKALSSADVARELMGASNGQPTSHGHTSYRWDCGGITIQVYDTRIDLAKHGLGAAIESAAQE